MCVADNVVKSFFKRKKMESKWETKPNIRTIKNVDTSFEQLKCDKNQFEERMYQLDDDKYDVYERNGLIIIQFGSIFSECMRKLIQ